MPRATKGRRYSRGRTRPDAPAAIGIVLLGWYYGEGDFAKSVCLAVNCGEDSDCTAGTLGSILGIIAGESNLPEKWKNACSQQIATCTLRTDNVFLPKTISELCVRITGKRPWFYRITAILTKTENIR
ncbi:MAG: ADP-ribosylglycohydrolase family protein [Christensenellales bacterium]